MPARVLSSAILGIDAYVVDVEASLSGAKLPRFITVGLPEGAVKESKERVTAAIKNSGFKFQPAAGTFFQLLDYSEISKEDDVGFARRLTKEIGVASIPISVFYESPPDEQKLRFCFAKNDDILEEAATKLCKL